MCLLQSIPRWRSVSPKQELYWNGLLALFVVQRTVVSPKQELYWNYVWTKRSKKKHRFHQNKSCIEIFAQLFVWLLVFWFHQNKSCIEMTQAVQTSLQLLLFHQNKSCIEIAPSLHDTKIVCVSPKQELYWNDTIYGLNIREKCFTKTRVVLKSSLSSLRLWFFFSFTKTRVVLKSGLTSTSEQSQ